MAKSYSSQEAHPVPTSRPKDQQDEENLTNPTGIGLSVTQQAYTLGAKILVADLKTTADFDAFASGKPEILYVQSDVTQWADFDKMFAACEAKWGDVPDAYAICAGLFDPPFSNFWQDPEQDEGYKQVDVNVNHPIKLTRLAMRKSVAKGKRASLCIIVCISILSAGQDRKPGSFERRQEMRGLTRT